MQTYRLFQILFVPIQWHSWKSTTFRQLLRQHICQADIPVRPNTKWTIPSLRHSFEFPGNLEMFIILLKVKKKLTIYYKLYIYFQPYVILILRIIIVYWNADNKISNMLANYLHSTYIRNAQIIGILI